MAKHGHAAMFGVFGMLAVGLMVYVQREVTSIERWGQIEKYVRTGFWGLNVGLALMIVLSLFPGGVLQILDVLQNGYWHARSLEYTGSKLARLSEWMRIWGDVVFILLGVLPIVIGLISSYRGLINRHLIPAELSPHQKTPVFVPPSAE